MRTNRILVVLPLMALSACISLPFSRSEERPAPAVYTLRAPSPAEMQPPSQMSTRETIVVPRPQLPPGFDTNRIVLYFQGEQRLDYYADATWPARLDDLVQDFVIERAQQRLPGSIVGKPDLTTSANYRLALRVVEFAPVYPTSADTNSTPRLDVAITVTVIALPQDEVKAQFTVRKTAVASQNRLSTITSELAGLLQSLTDEALQRAAPQLIATTAN